MLSPELFELQSAINSMRSAVEIGWPQAYDACDRLMSAHHAYMKTLAPVEASANKINKENNNVAARPHPFVHRTDRNASPLQLHRHLKGTAVEVSVTQRIALGKALRALREMYDNETEDPDKGAALTIATDRLLTVMSLYNLITDSPRR